VGEEIYHLSKMNPRTLLGKGTAAGIPVCDREAVILNVFLRHAKTKPQ